jgi:hypothetical protein
MGKRLPKVLMENNVNLNKFKMSLYYYLYCRIYDWYNYGGKKDKDTLRVSAIALLSVLPCVNILSVVLLISVLYRNTIMSKTASLAVFALFTIVNLLLISSKKSDRLRSEYLLLSNEKKRQINTIFYSYLIISLVAILIVLGYTIYFKKVYGNYDLTQ